MDKKSSDNQSLVQECDMLNKQLVAKEKTVFHASNSAHFASKSAKNSLESAKEAHLALKSYSSHAIKKGLCNTVLVPFIVIIRNNNLLLNAAADELFLWLII